MKRNQLIKTITTFGAVFVRHGGKHDWYKNIETGVQQPVPRHNDINEMLAKSIIKKLSNPL
ncbi:MAG: type II toxin-antitoxin system HicA family toxin [Marinilabiliaceae bacterium]|nr:type II toxin-antitoxin system HicA family toxin [Marinilabiliaceae bacterium]